MVRQIVQQSSQQPVQRRRIGNFNNQSHYSNSSQSNSSDKPELIELD